MIHDFSAQATNNYFEVCRKFYSFNHILQEYKSYSIPQISKIFLFDFNWMKRKYIPLFSLRSFLSGSCVKLSVCRQWSFQRKTLRQILTNLAINSRVWLQPNGTRKSTMRTSSVPKARKSSTPLLHAVQSSYSWSFAAVEFVSWTCNAANLKKNSLMMLNLVEAIRVDLWEGDRREDDHLSAWDVAWRKIEVRALLAEEWGWRVSKMHLEFRWIEVAVKRKVLELIKCQKKPMLEKIKGYSNFPITVIYNFLTFQYGWLKCFCIEWKNGVYVQNG